LPFFFIICDAYGGIEAVLRKDVLLPASEDVRLPEVACNTADEGFEVRLQ